MISGASQTHCAPTGPDLFHCKSNGAVSGMIQKSGLPDGCRFFSNFVGHPSNDWSASPNANNSGNAWNVNFNNGHANFNNRNNNNHVRLVRGGE